MKNNNNMLRNVIILLITCIIIFSTIQHTNVNCAKIEVSVNGDETTLASSKGLLQRMPHEMLIKEIRRRGYKVVKKRQEYDKNKHNNNNKDNNSKTKRRAQE